MRDVVALDELQVLLGIEALHDDRRAAAADRQADGALRRRVVQRGRRQVDLPLPVAPLADEELHQGQRLVRRDVGQLARDPLRSPGRARRVEHRRPLALVGDRRGGVAGHRRQVVLERGLVVGAVDDQPAFDGGAHRHDLAGDVELLPRRDEHPRLAVVDDVGELLGRQVRVDARVVEARPLARPAHLHVAGVVLHEDRVVVEPLEPLVAQQVREAVGALLELAVGDDLATRGHDERRLIGARGGVLPRVHGPDVGSLRCR